MIFKRQWQPNVSDFLFKPPSGRNFGYFNIQLTLLLCTRSRLHQFNGDLALGKARSRRDENLSCRGADRPG